MTNFSTAGQSGLSFTKGHGTGNDFILTLDPAAKGRADAVFVAALCDRHRGIGADGEWFMDYRNADGSVAQMCGNGVRVFAHFLLAQGVVDLPDAGELAVGTRSGVKRVRRSGDGYAVDMGPWGFIDPDTAVTRGTDSLVSIAGLDVDRPALSLTMGNPHAVVALADSTDLDAADLHRAPVVRPTPAGGTNVEIVVPADPLVGDDGIGRLSMRVHERGVGETRSCGSGACAAAVATRFWAGTGAPDRWLVTVPGGTLGVDIVPGVDGREHVQLSGPAVLVADGTLLADDGR